MLEAVWHYGVRRKLKQGSKLLYVLILIDYNQSYLKDELPISKMFMLGKNHKFIELKNIWNPVLNSLGNEESLTIYSDSVATRPRIEPMEVLLG